MKLRNNLSAFNHRLFDLIRPNYKKVEFNLKFRKLLKSFEIKKSKCGYVTFLPLIEEMYGKISFLDEKLVN